MYNESLNPLKKNLRNPLITSVYKSKVVPLWHNKCAWPLQEDTLIYIDIEKIWSDIEIFAWSVMMESVVLTLETPLKYGDPQIKDEFKETLKDDTRSWWSV